MPQTVLDYNMQEFLLSKGFQKSGKNSWCVSQVDVTILTSGGISLAVVLSPTKGCLYEEYCYIIDNVYDEVMLLRFKCRVTELIKKKTVTDFKSLFTS